LLYTVSTVVLVIQTIYYDYIYKLCRHRRTKICQKDEEDEEKRPLKPPKTMGSAISIPGGSYKDSSRREFYYTYGLLNINHILFTLICLQIS
jgi:hypothetical protein